MPDIPFIPADVRAHGRLYNPNEESTMRAKRYRGVLEVDVMAYSPADAMDDLDRLSAGVLAQENVVSVGVPPASAITESPEKTRGKLRVVEA